MVILSAQWIVEQAGTTGEFTRLTISLEKHLAEEIQKQYMLGVVVGFLVEIQNAWSTNLQDVGYAKGSLV